MADQITFAPSEVRCTKCGQTSTIRRPNQHPPDVRSLRWECGCGAVHELSVSEEEAAARKLRPARPGPDATGIVEVTAGDATRSGDGHR